MASSMYLFSRQTADENGNHFLQSAIVLADGADQAESVLNGVLTEMKQDGESAFDMTDPWAIEEVNLDETKIVSLASNRLMTS